MVRNNSLYDDNGSRDDWRSKGLCGQTDPEIFNPEKGSSYKLAKTVCRACEVTVECLEYALENGETSGVWGGTSPNERTRLRRRLGITAV